MLEEEDKTKHIHHLKDFMVTSLSRIFNVNDVPV
jgi:hypothetical protein